MTEPKSIGNWYIVPSYPKFKPYKKGIEKPQPLDTYQMPFHLQKKIEETACTTMYTKLPWKGITQVNDVQRLIMHKCILLNSSNLYIIIYRKQKLKNALSL